jgi:pre-rRNA-processing protein IPI3
MTEVILASVPSKSLLHVLDTHSGASLHALKDCSPTKNGVCGTNGYVLANSSSKAFVHAWSWQKEQPRFRCQLPERLGCLACTADGAHCIGGGLSGKLYLWQVSTGRLLLAWDGHFKPVTAVACALCDGYVLSAGEDAIVLAWSFADLLHAAQARQAAPMPYRTWTDHALPVAALCVGACGQHDLIASASADQTVRLWRLSDACRGCLQTLELPAALTAIAAHPRHARLYAGGADGHLYGVPLLLETAPASDAASSSCSSAPAAAQFGAPSTLRSSLTSGSGALRSIVVSIDGTRLFSASADPGLRVWDARTLALLLHVQRTLPIEGLVLVRRPDTLAAATDASWGTDGAATADAAAGSDGTAATAASTFNVAPLKKFAEAAAEMGGEASQRAMGCVPCELRRIDAASVAPALLESGDEAGLPICGGGLLSSIPGLPPPSGYGSQGMNGEPATIGIGATEGATGETVRQLREQVSQLQRINQELYDMAANATLGLGPARGPVHEQGSLPSD